MFKRLVKKFNDYFKEGFTLLELLAVIIIMAIVFGLVLPTIIKSIKTSDDKYIDALKEQLVFAAKDYFYDEDDELPRGQIINGDEIKTVSQVWISQLESGNYLSNDVTDPSGSSCEKSFILVTNNNNEFEYKVCLRCENEDFNSSEGYCDLLDVLNKDYQAPICNISYEGYIPGSWATGPVTATFTGIPDEYHDIVKITGFENRGVAPTVFNNASSYDAVEYQVIFDETSSLNYWVYDNNGKVSPCYDDVYINQVKIDDIDPYCTVTYKNADGTDYVPGSWSNQSVIVSWSCDDDESGLSTLAEDSQTFSSDRNDNFSVVAIDNSDNQEVYDSLIKIDKTSPVVSTFSGGSSSWTTGSRTLTVDASDSLSGISKYQFYYNGNWYDDADGVRTFSSSINQTVKARVIDNAGNISSEVSTTVKIDTSAPSVPSVTGGSSTPTSGSRTLTATSSDSISGISKYQFYFHGVWHDDADGVVLYNYTIDETVSVRAVNNAGLVSSNATASVRVDKTAPTISVSPSGGTVVPWTKITMVCSDVFTGVSSFDSVDNTGDHGWASETYANTRYINLVAEGSRWIETTCTDGVGNTKVQMNNYTINTSSPPAGCYTSGYSWVYYSTDITPEYYSELNIGVSCTSCIVGYTQRWRYDYNGQYKYRIYKCQYTG